MQADQTVGVVGAGMMGAEIALCFAMAGHRVLLKETCLELAEKGKGRLDNVLERLTKKNRVDAGDKLQILDRIIPVDKYDPFSDAALVVEAVFEDEQVKKRIFHELDTVCPPLCIFATNTSSIPITVLASAVGQARIGRFIGTHFFSPVSLMELVEVIPGLDTDEETIEEVMAVCRQIGKTPIRVKDVTGFAVNRLLHAMWIEANRLLEEGVASVEDIDIACRLGLGHPIGAYALMDLTGNDLNLQVQQILYDAYGERFRPRPVLKQMVNARHLGRKTGRGWFRYKPF
ncbi:MAG: 3-hydroxyacyl-CoA dehydrogenase family protein [Desulfohalobiaceae bacterium]|nr:3-hydroxyacyl-CoA dehydrogenase family protein [Desulfohalobiaceae bacterium]